VFLSHDSVARLQPKLLDFGIARFVEADHKLTQDGTLLGTPHYMSPEQARGENVIDARSDVWSFSVLLYELIAGQQPFMGDNYNALLWAIGHEERGASATSEWAPGAERHPSRGLRKTAADRWESMRSMGAELAAWLHGQGFREDVAGVSLRKTWLEGTPMDPGPDSVFADPDVDQRSRLPTDKVQITVVGQDERHTGETRTGVFERPVAPVDGRKLLSRRRLLGLGVGVLLVAAVALAVSTRWIAEPLGSTLQGDEAARTDQAARTDLALPLMMATEVSSAAPAPSTAASAELSKKHAPFPVRSSSPRSSIPSSTISGSSPAGWAGCWRSARCSRDRAPGPRPRCPRTTRPGARRGTWPKKASPG